MTEGAPHIVAESAAPAPAVGDVSLVCPRCGYDLRGATSDRCSECGLVVDRAAAAVSGVPWPHRRDIGRVRAFLRTVWQVTWDSRRLRHEMARPQDVRDAARFRRVNAALLAVTLLVVAAVLVRPEMLVAKPPDDVGFGATRPAWKGWLQDLKVPWAAGLAVPGVRQLCVVALAVAVAGVAGSAARVPGGPDAMRDRARAMADYSAAPLALLLPCALVAAAGYGLLAYAGRPGLHVDTIGTLRKLSAWVVFPAAGAAAVVLLTSLRRSGQWNVRARHAGLVRFAAAALELMGRSVVAAGVWLALVPWCVGLIWVTVDAFR